MIDLVVKIYHEHARIKEQAKRDERRALFRAGALGRRIFKNSIKFSKRTNSSPGSIMRTHKNNGVKNLVRFEVDVQKSTVVVGIAEGEGFHPGDVDSGGTASIKTTKAIQRKTGRKRLQARIRKRPTAAPALDAYLRTYADRPWVT